MEKMLCIGSACKDMFLPTEDGLIIDTPEDLVAKKKIAFELGAKYDIRQRHEALGGCSVNVAVGVAKIGKKTACHSLVGRDEIGKWIKQELSKTGVDTSGVFDTESAYSDFSAILIDQGSGERTIFSSHGSSRILKINTDVVANYERVFIGDLSGDWKGNLENIIEIARRDGIKLAFNPRQQMIHDDAHFVRNVIGMSEIVLLNKDEAVEILLGTDKRVSPSDADDEVFLLGEMLKTGSGCVAITDGIRGAWAGDGAMMVHADALRHDSVKDTTGAGDAFASGFIGAILNGRNIEDAICWGIVNSSNSIRYYGGQEGLLSTDELMTLSDNVRPEKII